MFYKSEVLYISRNRNRFVDSMANVASLTPIPIEDEKKLININSLNSSSIVDGKIFFDLFEKCLKSFYFIKQSI